MVDVLRQAQEFLEQKRHEFRSVPVMYTTRGGAGIQLDATTGRESFEYNDDAGALISVTTRDYLIRAEDLVVDNERVLPEIGDTITETIGEDTIVQEVSGPGGNPHWRWSDPNHLTYRIHTLKAN